MEQLWNKYTRHRRIAGHLIVAESRPPALSALLPDD
jgi:hypothetical protein